MEEMKKSDIIFLIFVVGVILIGIFTAGSEVIKRAKNIEHTPTKTLEEIRWEEHEYMKEQMIEIQKELGIKREGKSV